MESKQPRIFLPYISMTVAIAKLLDLRREKSIDGPDCSIDRAALGKWKIWIRIPDKQSDRPIFSPYNRNCWMPPQSIYDINCRPSDRTSIYVFFVSSIAFIQNLRSLENYKFLCIYKKFKHVKVHKINVQKYSKFNNR